MDSWLVAAVVSFDIRKVFDSVAHGSLIETLIGVGSGGNTRQCVHSYLVDRKQQSFISTRRSDYLLLTSGVPQVRTVTILVVPQWSAEVTWKNTCEKISTRSKLLLMIAFCLLLRKLEKRLSKVWRLIWNSRQNSWRSIAYRSIVNKAMWCWSLRKGRRKVWEWRKFS